MNLFTCGATAFLQYVGPDASRASISLHLPKKDARREIRVEDA
jgi:hypothetical protein